ncbi:hypothetical protein GIW23_01520 [Pseudomonas syringae]|nr:hypothetical protein [Pseudomonas syringae]MCF5200878.1 hypothetical protein [Pseudomonas syringae]MCF5202408.1 hypothetical protein [Pseudomonas syringae]MCF5216468.1 hypothetical protein [Pseudomonas syringae]MCF5220445.1 hypothetical protein [Pseudomonas syringae]
MLQRGNAVRDALRHSVRAGLSALARNPQGTQTSIQGAFAQPQFSGQFAARAVEHSQRMGEFFQAVVLLAVRHANRFALPAYFGGQILHANHAVIGK